MVMCLLLELLILCTGGSMRLTDRLSHVVVRPLWLCRLNHELMEILACGKLKLLLVVGYFWLLLELLCMMFLMILLL